ncbi:hypothetical protein EVAR_52020_1 [Eumeta japonica]|uniref:Uncharacterized protein n=1 Tax=Eumeta variegata TaxID=151549 RepID=A0A4C1YXB1_EUMVA|nr:hypothetical protein EVAR_52020_1 [Eumeta japonica]
MSQRISAIAAKHASARYRADTISDTRSEVVNTRQSTATTESRNSVTKIKPNTPHSAYHVARPSVRLTCMYMARLYEARTDRDDLLPKSDEYVSSFPNSRVPWNEDMLGTRIDTEGVGVAHSTVNMHRIMMHNKASIEAIVARRVYDGVPYLSMRIAAAQVLPSRAHSYYSESGKVRLLQSFVDDVHSHQDRSTSVCDSPK